MPSTTPSLGIIPGNMPAHRLKRKLGSSSFDDAEEDERERVQREAQDLEQLIRQSRGVIMEVVEQEWKEAMDAMIEAEGERLCAEAYEGYESNGRGCIFVSKPLGTWPGFDFSM